jgi:hypothetical protein
MTDPIKARIQSLCPDIMTSVSPTNAAADNGYEILGSPITLAVLLRATVKKKGSLQSVIYDGDAEELLKSWNLAKDNYDDQTKETQEFIGSLLGV